VSGQVIGVLALIAGGDVFVYTAIVGGATVATTLVGWKVAGLRPTLPTLDRALLREFRDFIWGGFPFLTWNLTNAVIVGIDRVLLGLLVGGRLSDLRDSRVHAEPHHAPALPGPEPQRELLGHDQAHRHENPAS